MLDDDFFSLGLDKRGAREVHSDRNLIAKRLKSLGQQHGLHLQVYYLPLPFNYYVVLATNGSGIRYHFSESKTLDARILENARFVFFINRNAKKYFAGLREKQRYKRIREWASFQDTNRGVARETKRLHQRLGRVLGVTQGKTNLPY